MDLSDILDGILGSPVADLLLSRGDKHIWIKKRCVSFLLTLGSMICLLGLISSIHSASVIGIVIWAIGTLLLTVFDIWYTIWWLREGRFGAEFPLTDRLIDGIPLPKADLNNTLPEDKHLGSQSDPNIWEQMGVDQ